ncbi:MAG: mevalonate kinase [Anaerolineae bacterium]
MTRASVQSSAPGKVILFGEHAVVYGEPAIAVPVTQVESTATIEPASPGDGLTLVAADLGTRSTLAAAPQRAPLAVAARLTLSHLSRSVPDATLTVRSTIPIASGLGSGAAVSTALVRALARFLGHALTPAEVSDLVFEVEKIHHGTPSGIDNTVIAYEQPVYFVRGESSGPILMSVGAPFALLVADTGLPSPTRHLVDRVHWGWQRDPARYQALFERIGDVARNARRSIESGEIDNLGPLMNQNHALLTEVGVSSAILDRLVSAARAAGASGAKLSGAGQGGTMVALVDAETSHDVTVALIAAGAAQVIHTTVE